MRALALRITSNPVMRRELLERWRGKRAFTVVTIHVAVLAAFTLLMAWIGIRSIEFESRFGGGLAGSGPLLGRFLLENLLAVTMALAMLLAPAYAATQISGERERQTLALLRITLVSPTQIVLGKLVASVAWLLVLVLAAIPLTALGFFLGGVELGQLVRGVVTLLAMTIAVSAIGIGVSSMMKRSTPALVVTILVVGVITVGTLFAGLVEGAVRRFDFGPNGRPVSTLVNPFVGLADAVDAQTDFGFSGLQLPSVLSAFATLLPPEEDRFFQDGFRGGIGFEEEFPMAFDGPVPPDVQVLPAPGVVQVEGRPSNPPYWLLSSLLYLAIGAGALAVAARKVGQEGDA